MQAIELILGLFMRRQLGQGFRDWAQWAAEYPMAAAIQLDAIAGQLEAGAEARRPRRNGGRPWLARRQMALAERLRAQAGDLRLHMVGSTLAAPKLYPLRKPGT